MLTLLRSIFRCTAGKRSTFYQHETTKFHSICRCTKETNRWEDRVQFIGKVIVETVARDVDVGLFAAAASFEELSESEPMSQTYYLNTIHPWVSDDDERHAVYSLRCLSRCAAFLRSIESIFDHILVFSVSNDSKPIDKNDTLWHLQAPLPTSAPTRTFEQMGDSATLP